jgi:hypothetical protein
MGNPQHAQLMDVADRGVAGTAAKDILKGPVLAGATGRAKAANAANPNGAKNAAKSIKSNLPRDTQEEDGEVEARDPQLTGIADAAEDAAEAASGGASVVKAGAGAAKGSKSSKSVAKNTEKNQNQQSQGDTVATPEVATRDEVYAATEE